MTDPVPVSARDVGVAALRDAEVQHLRLDAAVARREEDVLRLEIAVDDAGRVRRDERRADGEHEVDEVARRHRTRALEAMREVLAREELHDEVGDAPLAAHVRQIDDVRVAQARGELRLAQEALARARDGGDAGSERLDGDALADLGVDRLVHGAHAARAEQANDLVLAEPRARGEGHLLLWRDGHVRILHECLL